MLARDGVWGARSGGGAEGGFSPRFCPKPGAAVKAEEQPGNEDEETGVDEAGDASIEPADPDVERHPGYGEPGSPVGSAKEEGSGKEAEDADEVDPEISRVVRGQNVAIVKGEADDVDDEIEPANEGDGEGPLHKCWVPV